ncbi:hypothetical protein JXB11_02025 [Candidatus Woesearchaeota archaeon]|nr:hypothetical protein [Candidatus Woesearchaeota archaeon]
MKKYFIIIMIALVLLISGCGKREDSKIDLPNPYEGSEGLVVEFIEGAPPDEVLMSRGGVGNDFPIAVRIRNNGAVDVDNYWFALAVEEPKLSVSGSHEDFGGNLVGKETSISGGMTVIETTATAQPIERDPEEDAVEVKKLSAAITATICYNYKTKHSASVCLDAEPYRLNPGEDVCEMAPEDFVNQGAPVAITRVEPSVVESNGNILPRFKIFVKNIGTGLIVNTGAAPYNAEGVCAGTTFTRENKVFNYMSSISARIGNTYLDCGPPTLKLTDDDANNFFLCEAGPSLAILRGRGSFTTELALELNYGYTESISKVISIQELIE